MKIIYLFINLILMALFPFSIFAMMPVIDAGAIMQLGYQLSQLKQQTEYIRNELQQLNGSQYQWSNAQSLINQLGTIMQETNGISYTASNMDAEFRRAYPGYQPPQNFSQQYKDNSNMTLNTLNGVMRSMGTSADDFQNENSRLAFLQRQSQSAEGQTQAIQASTQMASEMVSQTQLLRQTVMAQTNAQAAYYATEVQKDASERAELEKVVAAGSTSVPTYGSSGETLNPPG